MAESIQSVNSCELKLNLSFGERLMYLPISSFAMVMGLTGLAIGWQILACQLLIVAPISQLIGGFAAVAFLAMLVVTVVKGVNHGHRVKSEWQHPVKLNFFPAISISLLLQSVYWHHSQPMAAVMLWWCGALLQLVFTVAVVSRWQVRKQLTLEQSIPVRFIPAVGNIIVPITGVALGYQAISWTYFVLGLFFWVVLFAMVIARALSKYSLPEHLKPVLFILLAPPSVGFIAYTQLVGELDFFAKIMYAIAFIILLMLLFRVKMFLRLPFVLSSWAFSFPLAAFTIANFRLAMLTDMSEWRWFAGGLLVFCTMVIGWLLVNTYRAYQRENFCVPEVSGSP